MIRSVNLEMEMTRQKITELWIELRQAGNEAALTGYRNEIKRDINQQEEILAGLVPNRCECHGYILVSGENQVNIYKQWLKEGINNDK